MTGYTASSDFPTTQGAYQPSLKGAETAFVTELDPSGNGLVYSTYLGGSSFDSGLGIAVNAAGDAYVTGFTQSSDFPTTAGAYQSSLSGSDDAFVTELDPSGSGLVYSTYLGGSSDDAGVGIAVNGSGDAYVAGYTFSSDFPTTAGAYQPSLKGSQDAFVTELDSSGSGLVYSTYVGGSHSDEAQAIAVDGSGDAYVTGYTGSSDFPTTTGAYQRSLKANDNAFVTELDPSGGGLVYSTYLGGTGLDDGQGIALGGSGDAYVTGYTLSTDFPTTAGAYQASLSGSEDAFVTELDPSGSGLVYSTYLGGSNVDRGLGIAVGGSGDAYVTGYTYSSDFPTTAGAYQSSRSGSEDAFVTELDPSGSGLVYSTYLGGSNTNDGLAIAVGASGAAFVTGFTASSDFPTTAGAYQTSLKGPTDAFVVKLNLASPTSTSVSCSPSSVAVGERSTCTATVTDTGLAAVSTPTGSVSFRTSGSGSFSSTSCTLMPSGTSGRASCSVTFRPTKVGSGSQTITASYRGDSAHSPSRGQTRLKVVARSLRLSVSPRRVSAGNRRCFTFTATSDGHRVPRVRVTFAGRHARTTQRGTARICLALHAGRHIARATRANYRSASATVTATKPSLPPFTG